MNQLRNLIQWKNLTQEQKDGFDFENFKYEFQNGESWSPIHSKIPYDHCVYRLVIQDDKWYAMPDPDGSYVYIDILKGSDIKSPEKYTNLRPARLDDIPQPKKTLEQKIQEGDNRAVLQECLKSLDRVSHLLGILFERSEG